MLDRSRDVFDLLCPQYGDADLIREALKERSVLFEDGTYLSISEILDGSIQFHLSLPETDYMVVSLSTGPDSYASAYEYFEDGYLAQCWARWEDGRSLWDIVMDLRAYNRELRNSRLRELARTRLRHKGLLPTPGEVQDPGYYRRAAKAADRKERKIRKILQRRVYRRIQKRGFNDFVEYLIANVGKKKRSTPEEELQVALIRVHRLLVDTAWNLTPPAPKPRPFSYCGGWED